MGTDEEYDDPFDASAVWKTSDHAESIKVVPTELFPTPEFDVSAIKIDNPYAPKDTLENELRLPDLDAFEFDESDDLTQEIENLDISEHLQSSFLEGDTQDDLWSTDLDLDDHVKKSRFFSWEAFESQTEDHPSPFYLSEAGPAVFDEVLRNHVRNKQPEGRALRSDAVINCLFNLGLGRSSNLFTFDADTNVVSHTVPDGRMSGLSIPLTQGVISKFSDCGRKMRRLQKFVARTYESQNAFPSLVALANITSSVISVLSEHLENEEAHSLLQLEALFEKPHQVAAHLQELISSLKMTRSDTHLVTALYSFVESREEQDPFLRSVSFRILSRVAQPWLRTIQSWTGMIDQPTLGFDENNDFFAEMNHQIEDADELPSSTEYVYNADHMPYFIPRNEGEMIFETGVSIRFLRDHHPEHPLCSLPRLDIDVPRLDWQFTWEEVGRTAQRALAYETSLREALLEFSEDGPKFFRMPIERPESQHDDTDLFANPEKYLKESTAAFDKTPLPQQEELNDELRSLVFRASLVPVDHSSEEANTSFEPSLALSPLLTLIPILSVQARLVNATTLRLFFRSHHLRHHLDLQRQYHLLGDGVFLTRLSTALFSPDLKTAEREKGIIRTGATMGLRLGTRTTWPPASSELRLALMSVLSDCYHSSELFLSSPLKNKPKTKSLRDDEDLPGQLSFSVRQLPEAEIAKVMDAQSLYALDFLRLQYIPPPPIDLVITEASLEKYDLIFKFLCRLLRMSFVVTHLPQNLETDLKRRFRVEAVHFVTTISSYFYETGIRDKWTTFASSLSNIEALLRQEDEKGAYGEVVREGLSQLRKAHETCLDRIIFTLFLRKRHEKVMSLLESIFACVLGFVANHDQLDIHIQELYIDFQGYIKVFLEVCRGLSGKKNKKLTAAMGDEMDIERLIVKMDISRYYDDKGS